MSWIRVAAPTPGRVAAGLGHADACRLQQPLAGPALMEKRSTGAPEKLVLLEAMENEKFAGVVTSHTASHACARTKLCRSSAIAMDLDLLQTRRAKRWCEWTVVLVV